MINLCRFGGQHCVACCGLKYESDISEINDFMQNNTLLFYELVNNPEDLSKYVNRRLECLPKRTHICIYLGFLKLNSEPGCLMYSTDAKEDLRSEAPGAKCEPETICELMEEFQTFSNDEKEKFSDIIKGMNWMDFSLNIYTLFCQFRDPNSRKLRQFKEYLDYK